jgi:hypothetical protein
MLPVRMRHTRDRKSDLSCCNELGETDVSAVFGRPSVWALGLPLTWATDLSAGFGRPSVWALGLPSTWAACCATGVPTTSVLGF